MTTTFRRGGAALLVAGAALVLGGCAAYEEPGYATYPAYPGYSTYPAQPYYGQPAVVPGGYVGVDVYRDPGPRYWDRRPVAPYPYPPAYGRPGWNDRDRDHDRGRGWRGAPPQAQLPGVVPVVPPRGPGAGRPGGPQAVPFGDPRVGTGTIIPPPKQDSGNTP